MKLAKAFLISILFIIAITFAMENNETVTINYYRFISREIPVYLIVMLSIGIGILLVGFLGIFERARLTMKINRQKKKIKAMEKEMELFESRSLVESDSHSLNQEL